MGMHDLSPALPLSPPLGPGDDDPDRPRRGVAGPIRGPLGPGETAPEAPWSPPASMSAGPLGPGETPVGIEVQTMGAVTAPLGPGDRMGPEPPPRPLKPRLPTKYDKSTRG